MSEQIMRRNVVSAMKLLDAVAVENPAYPGTPDVNFIEGWIELKWLPNWPQRPDTIVRISTFTPQQRVWHFRRRRAGGQSWFLLQVHREWLLFDGAVAALIVNRATRAELISKTIVYWSTGFPGADLAETLAHSRLAPFRPKEEDIGIMRSGE